MLNAETTTMLGAMFGLVAGVTVRNVAIGCTILLAVPFAMYGYVWWVHDHAIGRLNSTSALDYIFGPLWPTLAAIIGFVAGTILRPVKR